jgi:hypothetical protein
MQRPVRLFAERNSFDEEVVPLLSQTEDLGDKLSNARAGGPAGEPKQFSPHGRASRGSYLHPLAP